MCAQGMQFLNGRGVDQDQARGFRLCLRGAEAGDVDAQADVGQMHMAGIGTERDFAAARKWLQAAAEGGSRIAARQLGVIYLEALGVEQDLNLARQWLIAAVKRGDDRAPLLLGQLFYTAATNPKYKKRKKEMALPAFFWLGLAAELDTVPANRERANALYAELAKQNPDFEAEAKRRVQAWRRQQGLN